MKIKFECLDATDYTCIDRDINTVEELVEEFRKFTKLIGFDILELVQKDNFGSDGKCEADRFGGIFIVSEKEYKPQPWPINYRMG